jgi:iron-sulfur cluster repair protein YtfE (RIC family)
MSEEIRELVERLEADHRILLSKLKSLEEWVAGGKASPNPEFWNRTLQSLVEIRDILKVHGEMEERKLFPVLRMATGEDSDWQLGMTEMQDGLILSELERLRELVSRQPRGISQPELKESTTHLTRWIHEHMEIEEKFLFPKALKLS